MSLIPKKTDPKPDRDFGSPYGPQPNGDDEAAGGADSSPFENEPSGERQEGAERRDLDREETGTPNDERV